MLERESPSILYGGRGALEKLLGSILEGRKDQPKPFERAQFLPAILLSWLLHWEAGDNMAAIQAFCVYVCFTPRCLKHKDPLYVLDTGCI